MRKYGGFFGIKKGTESNQCLFYIKSMPTDKCYMAFKFRTQYCIVALAAQI